MSTTLINISKAERALAAASSLDDILDIRDQAEAIRCYAKAQRQSLGVQNQAAEIKLKAERKAGMLLAKMPKPKGGRPIENQSQAATSLEDLGINKSQSSRWQRESTLNDNAFKGEVRVLFLEGEELVGAKQNRILNTSVLVAAHSTTKIPVSCVEQGRWQFRTAHFSSGETYSSSKLRHFLKASVSRSIRAEGSYCSDQGGVWREVARQQQALGACSDTGAMSDTFETHRTRLDDFREKVRYVAGASGLAVAVGEKLVAVDIFDKSSTCQKVWDRLMSGFVMDAMEVESTERRVEAQDVERLLAEVGHFHWERAQAVGEGEEYRAETPTGDHASALSFGGAVLHGSVLCQW